MRRLWLVACGWATPELGVLGCGLVLLFAPDCFGGIVASWPARSCSLVADGCRSGLGKGGRDVAHPVGRSGGAPPAFVVAAEHGGSSPGPGSPWRTLRVGHTQKMDYWALAYSSFPLVLPHVSITTMRSNSLHTFSFPSFLSLSRFLSTLPLTFLAVLYLNSLWATRNQLSILLWVGLTHHRNLYSCN